MQYFFPLLKQMLQRAPNHGIPKISLMFQNPESFILPSGLHVCYHGFQQISSFFFSSVPNNKKSSILQPNLMFYEKPKWSCSLWTVLWESKLSDCTEGGRVNTALVQDHKCMLLIIPCTCKLHLAFLLHRDRKETILQINGHMYLMIYQSVQVTISDTVIIIGETTQLNMWKSTHFLGSFGFLSSRVVN